MNMNVDLEKVRLQPDGNNRPKVSTNIAQNKEEYKPYIVLI